VRLSILQKVKKRFFVGEGAQVLLLGLLRLGEVQSLGTGVGEEGEGVFFPFDWYPPRKDFTGEKLGKASSEASNEAPRTLSRGPEVRQLRFAARTGKKMHQPE